MFEDFVLVGLECGGEEQENYNPQGTLKMKMAVSFVCWCKSWGDCGIAVGSYDYGGMWL